MIIKWACLIKKDNRKWAHATHLDHLDIAKAIQTEAGIFEQEHYTLDYHLLKSMVDKLLANAC